MVHDYSGHPGQAQLSRALAQRGYEVTHQHCPSYTTGKGSLERAPGDPAALTFESVAMDGTFARYSTFTRIRQELRYGRTAGRRIAAKDPSVAVLSNVPLLAHAVLARHLSRRGVPMVFWHQDIYSEAIGVAARRRLPILGHFVARFADRLERNIARRSAAVVAISPTFRERLSKWGVADKTTVVRNWAPLDELPTRPADNAWKRRMGLEGHPVVLYSGTLGLKHDPSILALIARQLRVTHPDARVVVVSEGKGRDWLEAWKADQDADNLVLLDFQPYEELPDMMASADLLVAILEPDASKFSVPSKVLTYLCSSRAILGVLPPDNSVAEILSTHGAGHVVAPAERDKVAHQVAMLLDDPGLRSSMGRAGRRYAEATFSPEVAADRFLEVFGDLVPQPRRVAATASHAPARRFALADREAS
ncbi:MAG TPA: glycosyltransferase family 4 protein [Acidimicrobiales bacterium]|nr:glycosyltransferase family 4 protein [Acidimicrobiales bacterium]